MKQSTIKAIALSLAMVMVVGVAILPVRANAITLTPADIYRALVWTLKEIAVEMLSSTTTSDAEAAAAKFSAYFESTLQEDKLYITADQMNDLSQQLVQMGIKVMPGIVPGSNLIALMLADDMVTTPLGSVRLDAAVGSIYTYEGRSVVRIPGGGAIDEDRVSYDNTSDTTTDVGINGDGSIVDFDVNINDSGSTTPGSYLIYNDFTNNWQIKNEYGDYVDIESLYYNPVTQNYDVSIDGSQYTYQFFYEYTYITYIGSSSEYREAYKIYYELPDGRSSGDLTADELKGLSLQFDMVNYDKVASDNLTQILLPFDGSIDNTSYYDVTTRFYQSSGYTFLESPDPFGGFLYSPISNAQGYNAFGATLSNPMPSGSGFTYQGRFYLDGTFSSTVNNFNDIVTFYMIGSSPDAYWENDPCVYEVFTIKGSTLYLPGNGMDTAQSVSVGVWHDFCFVFDPDLDKKVSFYLDGVRIFEGTHYAPCLVVSQLDNIINPSYSEDESLIQRWTFTGCGFSNGNRSCPLSVDNIRLVSAPLYSGASTITIPQAPFDTNLVYVLPSVANLNDNTVAIMSQIPVSGYRVGGIRPTDPTLEVGYVYMHIDGQFIDSVQQWNGTFWESVTARLYTGVRWIPVNAFNVYTLEDMYDIIDPESSGSGSSVDSIYKYYLWWNGEWGTFQEWLKGTLQTLIGAVQGGGSGPVVIVPGVNDQTTTNEIVVENPDGSVTKTTIVSNAAGLVYSRSVTTWPPDVDGNVKTRELYTDSTGAMYQTEWIVDKDGNVIITEPTTVTGTLSQILSTITQGVVSMAADLVSAFATIVVEGVKFIIESAGKLLDGVGSMLGSLVSSLTDFTDSMVGNLTPDNPPAGEDQPETVSFFDMIFDVFPAEIMTALTFCFVCMVVFPLINKMHF